MKQTLIFILTLMTQVVYAAPPVSAKKVPTFKVVCQQGNNLPVMSDKLNALINAEASERAIDSVSAPTFSTSVPAAYRETEYGGLCVTITFKASK